MTADVIADVTADVTYDVTYDVIADVTYDVAADTAADEGRALRSVARARSAPASRLGRLARRCGGGVWCV